MNLKVAIIALTLSIVSALPVNDQVVWSVEETVGTLALPTEKEAASIARTLVNRESLTNVNTIKTVQKLDGSVRKIPVSSMEYYVDCDNDGNPYWLVVDMSSAFQNIIKGSAYSLTIRTGDHPQQDKVDTKYPGAIESSPAGSPRINLFGRLQNVTFDNPIDELKLAACFVERHPDSKFWLPTGPVSAHISHWTKFIVEDAYFLGGFGSLAYIGPISGQNYHDASLL